MIAGWSSTGVVAPLTFKGYCNTKLVETWREESLIPELLPDQIRIIDNASFHQSSKIKELIEKARCKLIFLPPYSPDLNKIEKFWAPLKHYLRTTLSEFESLELALNNALKYVS